LTTFLLVALGGAGILIAHIALSHLITIAGARPDILLIYILWATLRYGRWTGLWLGFFLGLSQDALSLGPLGIMAFLKSNLAFWLAVWLEGRAGTISSGWWMTFVALTSLLQFTLAGLFAGVPDYAVYFLWTAIPAMLYTVLAGLIWALAPLGPRPVGPPGLSGRGRRLKR